MLATIEAAAPSSLAELFERLYLPHKLAFASASTIYQYRLNLKRFSEFLARPAMLTDLRDEQVAQCAGWCVRQQGLSHASAGKLRDNLCALWRFAARKGIVSVWPDVPPVPEPLRAPIAWTREQLAALWECLKRLPGDVCGIPASDWFCSLHATLWDTGERISATLGTKWEDVDLQAGWIVIRAERRKCGLSDHLCRLHPQTVELLSRVQEPARQLVWPWPFCREYLWTIYGGILERAGLPNNRQSKFHRLRKSVASHLALLGGDPQAAMGHSSREITERHYIDPRVAPRPAPADWLFRLGE